MCDGKQVQESKAWSRRFGRRRAIVAGTDGALPGQAAEVDRDACRAGMTPMQAIESATRSRGVDGLAKDAGTIEPGKRADLIVLMPIRWRRFRTSASCDGCANGRVLILPLWAIAGFK
jgi:adenine deaminase